MTQTRRGARRSTIKIEDEIKMFEDLAQSHRREIKNHQRKLALETQALEDAAKMLEDLRQKRIQEEKKREQRRSQEEKELERTKTNHVDSVMERDADLPWEKMSRNGVCGRCRELHIGCYRVIEAADTRRNQKYVGNAMKVRIGKGTYSRCQECRLKKRKCEKYTEAIEDTSPRVPLAVPVEATSPKGKRKRQATPDTPNTRAKLEGVLVPPAQLPTPSSEPSPSGFRVIPGSNTHFAIPVQATPGPSKQPASSVSRKVQELEKAIQDIRDEQRTTRERLEDAIGRLEIHSGRGRRVGGSKQANEDRDLSYVSESE